MTVGQGVCYRRVMGSAARVLTPNLQTLDALMRSLGIGEAPEWSTNPKE